jgi:hypothetical protein
VSTPVDYATTALIVVVVLLMLLELVRIIRHDVSNRRRR